MQTIVKTIQILVVGAGSDAPQALYEIQTSSNPMTRLIVARRSPKVPYLYFLDRAALTEMGIFGENVVELYADEWPADMQPELTAGGYLPSDFNNEFANADFGSGKTGVVRLNGYNPTDGSFETVKTTAAASSVVTPEPWYKRKNVRTYGLVALGSGVLFGFIAWLKRRK